MTVLQKKVCMVGVAGTGKTSLVRRFVHSRFSEKYHTTIGVKIDRKTVTLEHGTVNLLLWDLEGRSNERDVSPSYLRGAAGIIIVIDGTRRETLDQAFDLHDLVVETLGSATPVCALNKRDLGDDWSLTTADQRLLAERGWTVFETSAKTGAGVDDAFHWLARTMVGG